MTERIFIAVTNALITVLELPSIKSQKERTVENSC